MILEYQDEERIQSSNYEKIPFKCMMCHEHVLWCGRGVKKKCRRKIANQDPNINKLEALNNVNGKKCTIWHKWKKKSLGRVKEDSNKNTETKSIRSNSSEEPKTNRATAEKSPTECKRHNKTEKDRLNEQKQRKTLGNNIHRTK